MESLQFLSGSEDKTFTLHQISEMCYLTNKFTEQ